MSGTLRVLWTISSSSTTAPRPILRCRRCDAPRPFESNGKFRLNANGKRLDAWLIYRCADCGDAWNRAIFERRRRSEVDDAMLEALQCNDPALADKVARDFAGLARWTQRFADEGNGAFAIDKAVLDGSPADADRIAISLSLAAGTAMRCDRVLATGLGISRSRVAALAADGRIAVDGAGKKPLSWMLGHGGLVTIAFDGLADASELALRATGREGVATGPMPAD